MIRRQLIRFAAVGVVNTGTYYACYLLLLPWLPYVAAHVLAFAVSMVGSFFLTCRFTYNTRPTWRKFLLFPLTNAANFVITTSGVYLLVDVLRLDSTYAPLVAAAAAIPVTFVVSRMIMLGGPAPDAEAGGDSASTNTRESLGESVARTTPTA
ncbi:GtrA family protein [Streptomyces chryseus]|uniref:Sugar transferase n=1 Tax=Streptomyces chryseus TaxID=68186 RepID=A0ABQ3DMQ7_9ACTN|nr:GtrA family protein [Streptomyces chryseus]GGX22577.1 sugar transferase [Streptomyces chryseus]GHB03251.1 sugar transferase [Streptomyces chryseus]